MTQPGFDRWVGRQAAACFSKTKELARPRDSGNWRDSEITDVHLPDHEIGHRGDRGATAKPIPVRRIGGVKVGNPRARRAHDGVHGIGINHFGPTREPGTVQLINIVAAFEVTWQDAFPDTLGAALQ